MCDHQNYFSFKKFSSDLFLSFELIGHLQKRVNNMFFKNGDIAKS